MKRGILYHLMPLLHVWAAIGGFVVIAMIVSMLPGCATPAPTVVTTTTCLPMTSYTAAQEKAAGDALAALDAGSELVAMMTDYGALRAADRACIASSAPSK